MNRKTWAMTTGEKGDDQGIGEPFERIYKSNQILLQVRRTETQLTADPAPRCGFSIRGIEKLIRGAGSCAGGARQVLKVRWRREVAWEKMVRLTEA